MQPCFVYFGDNLFDKYESVLLNSKSRDSYANASFILFNSISTKAKKCVPVKAVFPSWHIVFFITECGIYHSGFPNGLESQYAAPVDQVQVENIDYNTSISPGWNQALIVTKQKSCQLVSFDDFKISHISDDRVNGKVKEASLNNDTGFIITDDGSAYTFGIQDQIAGIQLLPGLNEVSQIACGKEHTLLLTKCGQIHSFGNGSRGQLGHDSIDAEAKPRLIEAVDGISIVTIAAGGWHSAAISEFGDLYTWGWNESGQLGRPCNRSQNDDTVQAEEICVVPKLVNFKDDVHVKSVSLGSRHSAALLNDGTVWSWGWNKYCQLGNCDTSFQDSPGIVHLPKTFECHTVLCRFWSTILVGELKE